MLILKLEQNIFQELAPDKLRNDGIRKVTTWVEGDSLFRSTPVDFFEGVSQMTVERRKYPFFYKYYLYFDENLTKNIDLKTEPGTRFLIEFYKKYCPDYVKKTVYDETVGMNPEEYFYMEKIPGASMQRFVPGKGLEEELNPKEKDEKAVPVVSGTMEGYHEFTPEEKGDMGSRMDALKNQFADQLRDLEALMGKKV